MDCGSQFLSCDQLFETYSKRSPKPVYEPKKNINSKPSAEDEKYLQEKYQELETILSHQRVVKHGNVSLAEYSNGRIAVTQKVGKWEKFGFSVRNEQYLYPHEALFLVEIKRLMITQKCVVMSLEECFKIFLTDSPVDAADEKLTLPEYLVYATLTRNGLFVRLHVPIKIPMDDEELIWNHLEELLKAPGKETLSNPGCTVTPAIIQQMERSRSFIENNSRVDDPLPEDETNFEWPVAVKRSLKRKPSSWWSPNGQGSSSKRFKRNPKESKLDVLKALPEYAEMKSIFQQLEVNRIRPFALDEQFQSSFHFKFDIFNPKSKLDKKTALPSYRGIVCSSKQFPDYKDLIYLQQAINPTPVLIFHVDESMMIHGFLYEFE